MYENTKSSIDWKGLFLKVVIAFLIVLIAITGYKTLKSDNKKTNTTTTVIADSKSSSTFTANIEKLKQAGEKYFNNNKDKIPTEEGITTMVSLNDLIKSGDITDLIDENGKKCDGDSSYVTAILEGKQTKVKANLVCGESSSYSIVYLGENDTKVEETKETTKKENVVVSSTSTETKKTNTQNSTCTSNCGTPSVSANASVKVENNIKINSEANKTTTTTTTKAKRYYNVYFDKNGGTTEYKYQTIEEYNYAEYPGANYKSGYEFIGWYLNGELYNFNEPVTRDITLTAMYERNTSDNNWNSSSNNNWNNYWGNNSNNNWNNNYNNSIKTGLKGKDVYSLMWTEYGTNNIHVNHTLRVPEEIANNRDVINVRIKNISLKKQILKNEDNINYNGLKASTYIYNRSGWEYTNLSSRNLAKVDLNYTVVNPESYEFKNINTAIIEGFNVDWYSNRIINQCNSVFTVYGPNGNYDDNNCAYGIVYHVTWEYTYYN